RESAEYVCERKSLCDEPRAILHVAVEDLERSQSFLFVLRIDLRDPAIRGDRRTCFAPCAKDWPRAPSGRRPSTDHEAPGSSYPPAIQGRGADGCPQANCRSQATQTGVLPGP